MTPHERRQRAKEFLQRTNLIYMPGYAAETEAETTKAECTGTEAQTQTVQAATNTPVLPCTYNFMQSSDNTDKLLLALIVLQALILITLLMKK